MQISVPPPAISLSGLPGPARKAGSTAIDIEKSMVDYLNQRAGRENLPNLSSIRGQPDDPKLPEPVNLALYLQHLPSC